MGSQQSVGFNSNRLPHFTDGSSPVTKDANQWVESWVEYGVNKKKKELHTDLPWWPWRQSDAYEVQHVSALLVSYGHKGVNVSNSLKL